jgi:uncharacterized protein
MKEGLMITNDLYETIEHNPAFKNNAAIYDHIEKGIAFYIKQFDELIEVHGKEAFAIIQEGIDRTFADVLKRQRVTISCKKGCSACCHFNVDVDKEEVELIIDHCRENDIEIDKEYLLKQASYPSQDALLHSEDSACVFLKNHQCSIYECRPINCRKYMVVSDPHLCGVKTAHKQILRPYDIDIELMMSALLTRKNADYGSMPGMLLRLLDKKPQ